MHFSLVCSAISNYYECLSVHCLVQGGGESDHREKPDPDPTTEKNRTRLRPNEILPYFSRDEIENNLNINTCLVKNTFEHSFLIKEQCFWGIWYLNLNVGSKLRIRPKYPDPDPQPLFRVLHFFYGLGPILRSIECTVHINNYFRTKFFFCYLCGAPSFFLFPCYFIYFVFLILL